MPVLRSDLQQTASQPPEAAARDPLRSLFDRARAGDGAALQDLCRAVRPRLYQAAWAVLRDRDEADDVAQEALVRALQRRLLFLGTGSVGGWMTRIAYNLAKNRLRDARRRRELLERATGDERAARGAQAAAPVDAGDLLVRAEARRSLDQALAALPGRQRDVVRLRLLGELPFKDIADALSITEANARMAFSLGSKKISAALRAEETP